MGVTMPFQRRRLKCAFAPLILSLLLLFRDVAGQGSTLTMMTSLSGSLSAINGTFFSYAATSSVNNFQPLGAMLLSGGVANQATAIYLNPPGGGLFPIVGAFFLQATVQATGGADGFSLFLHSNANGRNSVGASGGNVGYASGGATMTPSIGTGVSYYLNRLNFGQGSGGFSASVPTGIISGGGLYVLTVIYNPMANSWSSALAFSGAAGSVFNTTVYATTGSLASVFAAPGAHVGVGAGVGGVFSTSYLQGFSWSCSSTGGAQAAPLLPLSGAFSGGGGGAGAVGPAAFAFAAGSTGSFSSAGAALTADASPNASSAVYASGGLLPIGASFTLNASVLVQFAPSGFLIGDGFTIILHNDPRGVNAMGNGPSGADLGYAGAVPGNYNVRVAPSLAFGVALNASTLALRIGAHGSWTSYAPGRAPTGNPVGLVSVPLPGGCCAAASTAYVVSVAYSHAAPLYAVSVSVSTAAGGAIGSASMPLNVPMGTFLGWGTPGAYVGVAAGSSSATAAAVTLTALAWAPAAPAAAAPLPPLPYSGFLALSSVNAGAFAFAPNSSVQAFDLGAVLANGGPWQASSAFVSTGRLPILLPFTVNITVSVSGTQGAQADGFAIILHNDPRGFATVGNAGNNMGYAVKFANGGSANYNEISPSLALGFEFYTPAPAFMAFGINGAWFGATSTPVSGTAATTTPTYLVSLTHAGGGFLYANAFSGGGTTLIGTTSMALGSGIGSLSALLGGATTAYVGVSASTGGATSSQTLIGFSWSATTPSLTPTATLSTTPSYTASGSMTPSSTRSPTLSPSTSSTISATTTSSASSTTGLSRSSSSSISPTLTGSASVSPSQTVAASVSPSSTPSPSATRSTTPTRSSSKSASPTCSTSRSPSATRSETRSGSSTRSVSPSTSASSSLSPSPSATTGLLGAAGAAGLYGSQPPASSISLATVVGSVVGAAIGTGCLVVAVVLLMGYYRRKHRKEKKARLTAMRVSSRNLHGGQDDNDDLYDHDDGSGGGGGQQFDNPKAAPASSSSSLSLSSSSKGAASLLNASGDNPMLKNALRAVGGENTSRAQFGAVATRGTPSKTPLADAGAVLKAQQQQEPLDARGEGGKAAAADGEGDVAVANPMNSASADAPKPPSVAAAPKLAALPKPAPAPLPPPAAAPAAPLVRVVVPPPTTHHNEGAEDEEL